MSTDNIRMIMRHTDYNEKTATEKLKEHNNNIPNVIREFLGIHKEGNTKQIIEDLEIYYSGADRLSYISKELNVTKLIYNYYWVDLMQAASSANRFKLDYSGGSANPVLDYEGTVTRPDGTQEEVVGRSSFVNKDWVLVYPDTLVWIADFTYSYNEPMTNMYFNSPSYDN